MNLFKRLIAFFKKNSNRISLFIFFLRLWDFYRKLTKKFLIIPNPDSKWVLLVKLFFLLLKLFFLLLKRLIKLIDDSFFTTDDIHFIN